MHRVLRLSWACLLGLPGCGRPHASDTLPASLPWTPFYWVRAVTDSARFDHAAILFRLQVRRAGPPSIVQLDLGGSGSMPDGFPLPARDIGAVPSLGRGQLYGLLGSELRLELTGVSGDSALSRWRESEVGTVGLPNYITQALILDFPNRRLASIPPPQGLEALLGPGAITIPLERGRFDRAVVPLSTTTGQVYQALLDTGLSPFPVWTTREIWERLTGRLGPGQGTRRYRLNNRRGGMVFVGASPEQALRIGAWRVEPNEVVYLERGPVGASIEEWQSEIQVVLGATLWARRGVLLLDLAHHRVGIVARLSP